MVYDSTQLSGYFLECNSDTCLGNFKCKEGYTGVLCYSCSPDRFYWGGSCDTACAQIEPQKVTTVLSILGVLSLWIVINKFNEIAALDLTLWYATLLFLFRAATARVLLSLAVTCKSWRPSSALSPRTPTAVHGTPSPFCSECLQLAASVGRCVPRLLSETLGRLQLVAALR
jgi:hypothetical protein